MRDKSLQGNGGDSVRRTQCSFVFFWILWHKSRTFLHVIHPKVDHIFSHNAAFCCDEIVCQGQEGTVVCNPLCWLGPTWDIPLSLSICHSCSISLSLCLSLYLFLIISRSLSLYTSLSFTSPLYFSFSPSHFLCVSHSLSLFCMSKIYIVVCSVWVHFLQWGRPSPRLCLVLVFINPCFLDDKETEIQTKMLSRSPRAPIQYRPRVLSFDTTRCPL